MTPAFKYWEDGVRLKSVAPYIAGKVHGKQIKWYRNGQIESEETYKDGIKFGLHTFWYTNGQKRTQGKYKDGKRDGLWTEWSKDGGKTYDRLLNKGLNFYKKECVNKKERCSSYP